MKEIFVATKNTKKYESALQRINHKYHGVERLALLTGQIGLGKTISAIYFGVNKFDTIYVRVWPRMTQHWLLRILAKELDLEPAWRTEKLIEQIRDALVKESRTIVFDEFDHFFRDNDAKRIDALESLRGIHDICGCPMIFIGEEGIEKKIARVPRLADRIVETVKFEKYKEVDVKDMIGQLSEYRFENDAIQKITQMSQGRIRPIMRLIHAAEGAARIHQLKVIGAKDF